MPSTPGFQAETPMSRTYKTRNRHTRDRGSMFDTKIAVLLRDDLAGWQALNVTAFLVSGLPDELRGKPYVDADDVHYLPMFGQPVVVLQGDKDLVKKAHERALN